MYDIESAVENGTESTVERQYRAAAEISSEWLRSLYLPDHMDQTLQDILKQLCEFMSAQHSFLYEWNDMGWQLQYEWDAWVQQMCYGKGDSSEGEGKPGWNGPKVVLPGQAITLEEVSPSLVQILQIRGISADQAAVVSLFDKGELIGCIGISKPDMEMLHSISYLLDLLGGMVVMARRLADEHKEVEYLHLYDGLTGAFNRGTYLNELQSDQSDEISLGIIRFQLTDVKRMNECFGYAYGNDLLVKCIKRVSELFGSMGNLYRVGCDEFAIICKGLEMEDFESIANKLCPEIEENLHCAVAIGYQWTTKARTIRRLDLAAEAMMEEDQQKYTRIQALTERQRVMGEDFYGMLTIDGVTTLLDAGRFLIYLQPKLSFKDGTLVGAEALVRFEDTTGEIVEPGDFVPDLETSMLIRYVDLYVFEHACELIRNWLDGDSRIWIPISVNFSKITLEEPNLVGKLLHICRKYDVDPSCLEVEIAGGLDKQQAGSLGKIVEKIHAAGFVITVDNFGIRFANLSLLIALDCDKLKVDRRMVENVATSAKAQTVLRALAELCSATGTKTTVEGIETKEQLAMLKNMGFDEMQGYLISQPITIDEFGQSYLCER